MLCRPLKEQHEFPDFFIDWTASRLILFPIPRTRHANSRRTVGMREQEDPKG